MILMILNLESILINEHAGSYSYVLTKVGDEYYFVDTLTDGVSKDKLKA